VNTLLADAFDILGWRRLANTQTQRLSSFMDFSA
jgi:hypothetical protein